MKFVAYILLSLFVTISHAQVSEKYTNRYDDLNIEDVLTNRRFLVSFIKCVLEIGKCSPEGRELKSHIREALANNCARCTEPQRRSTLLVIAHLVNSEPDYWKQLTEKYDRDHKYAKRYEAQLNTFKI
ncbi:unnamed protein product [Parnassius apollo]|uniref:(apollo) hypothetical protein n=1 Tax=Parnassius apollo TaxID=110799 RepID=A0A8S3Y0K4_PARAO|nr:unnamed protein product [Parnassius apollo]